MKWVSRPLVPPEEGEQQVELPENWHDQLQDMAAINKVAVKFIVAVGNLLESAQTYDDLAGSE